MLEGTWVLVTTYKPGYSQTYTRGILHEVSHGGTCRVKSSTISSCEVREPPVMSEGSLGPNFDPRP